MALLRRKSLTLILLLLYWPGIFILSHLPRVPEWVIEAPVSDKTLHYLAYLVLVFLMWFAMSPDKKVNWRKATVWWVLFVVVWYGVFDEWLQGYVGRNPNVMDFFADLAGALTSLVLLSVFSFWPASVALTGAVIFVLTNFTQASLADILPVTNAVLHLFAYAFFSLLWIQCMYHLLPLRAPEPKWLIGALVLPMGFLLGIELFSAVAGDGLRLSRVVISALGIVAVVVSVFLMALFRRRFRREMSPNDV